MTTARTLRMATPKAVSEGALAQLRRALKLQRDQYDHMNDEGIQLVRRSIFAAYLEARSEGVGDEALALIRGAGLKG